MNERSDIHDLFLNHDRIKRTVTNLPDGIRTVTESDDPQVVAVIKKHVAEMGRRVEEGRDPGLPIETPALHAIFRNKDKIKSTYEVTLNGDRRTFRPRPTRLPSKHCKTTPQR